MGQGQPLCEGLFLGSESLNDSTSVMRPLRTHWPFNHYLLLRQTTPGLFFSECLSFPQTLNFKLLARGPSVYVFDIVGGRLEM